MKFRPVSRTCLRLLPNNVRGVELNNSATKLSTRTQTRLWKHPLATSARRLRPKATSRPGKLHIEQLIYALTDMARACSRSPSCGQVVDASGCANCSAYRRHSALQTLNSHIGRGFGGF